MSVQLAHPGSGAPAAFLLGAGGSVAEVQVYRKTYAAWLTGQASVADGGLWLASRLDPLLLLLPALETMRAATSERPDGMFVELPSGLLDLPGGAALAELVPPLLGAGGEPPPHQPYRTFCSPASVRVPADFGLVGVSIQRHIPSN